MNSGSQNGFVLWKALVMLVDFGWVSTVGSCSSGNRVEDSPGAAEREPAPVVSYPNGTLKKARELTIVFMMLILLLGIYTNL
jgi:hypothetical protein